MSKDMIVEHDVTTLDLISLHLLGHEGDIAAPTSGELASRTLTDVGYPTSRLQMARLLKTVDVATARRRGPDAEDDRC